MNTWNKFYCCGRHVSQLKPFGKTGDPLVGDFDGALLVRRYRVPFPPNEEVNEIIGNEDKEKEYLEKYGQEKFGNMMLYQQLSMNVSISWECRDCICLSTKRYHRLGQNLFYGKPE